MYQPFHQKYRPQCFADLVGQEAIATALSNGINLGRIAHAYLFTGPRGTGKTSSARILAKSLNCLNHPNPTSSPCGQCASCQGITSGIALDILELDAASNNGVEQIREICTGAHLTPVQARYKIYVIDEVHGLSGAATQALLKTLEEPPHNVVFVLCTTEPQKLPNTIISRCQRYNFQRISIEAMVKHLNQIAQLEDLEMDSKASHLVAQLATGGLRDALSLLEQLSLLESVITSQLVWELVGAVPQQELLSLVEAIASDSELDTINQVQTLLNFGKEPLVILHNLTQFYTLLLIAQTGKIPRELSTTEVELEQLQQLAKSLGRNGILASIQHLRTCESQIKFSTQSWLWLEVAVLGLLPSSQPNHSPANTHSKFSPNSLPPASLSGVSVPPQQVWQTVLAKVPPSLKVLLSQHCALASFSEDSATIQVNSTALKARVDHQRATLESAFAMATQRTIKVSILA
ncbi:DNA polymerase III subunit gamma/tau [Planktothrix paucivesiculata]|uniref:DNA polymerase III subunit gamma/tau n=1 Tax=Planktothrix paucivesiculata PCC 9631 TaxID=671071 RepID=A0A7Z9E4K7_9CYAN